MHSSWGRKYNKEMYIGNVQASPLPSFFVSICNFSLIMKVIFTRPCSSLPSFPFPPHRSSPLRVPTQPGVVQAEVKAAFARLGHGLLHHQRIATLQSALPILVLLLRKRVVSLLQPLS